MRIIKSFDIARKALCDFNDTLEADLLKYKDNPITFTEGRLFTHYSVGKEC